MPAQKRSSSENLEEEEDEEKVVEVKDEEEEEEVEQQEQQDEEVVEAEAEAEAAGEEAGGDGDVDVDDVDEDDDDEDEEEEEDEDDDEDDSNGSRSSKTGKNDEYVTVNLADIRKEVQCPICLGIIRKTRTVMECLHRFCRECIDKSMRMGNNECPACRTHCASRRSLRDDPNYDALIAALYQDIDKYEAEELAFREEEKNRNKQIQASIAQTFQRQTEALGRKRTTAKNGAALPRRSRGRRKGRKNSRVAEPQGSDDDEYINGNEGGRDSSSADERVADFKPKRFKRWSGQRFSQSSAVDADGGDGNDDMEVCRESTVASSGLLASPEVLAWGRGGVRSHTRYGSVSGNGKSVRNRMAKLVDHLKNSEDNFDKLDVHLIVIPLDKQSIPSLEEPFLCCKSTTSVGHLCQFVALQTPLQAEEIELLVVKEPKVNPLASDPVPMIDLTKDKLQLVAEQDSLGGLLANCNFDGSHMVLAYRRKVST